MTSLYKSRTHAIKAGASLAAILLSAGGALAQSADDDNLVIEEVTVTAQKRVQSTQDVPVSITAFDANFTKRVNIDDVKDLVKFAPGFAGDSKDSFIDYINIRGISTNDFGVGGDPSVGFFKNGLYQGRNGVVVTSMFDMERAEVLRGPQGFLFGRNAISGAVSLYTAKPNFDSASGYVELGAGERGILEMEAWANIPMNDNFALRLAAYHSEEDGYADNAAEIGDDNLVAHDKTAFRATAGMRGESWDATLMVEYEDREQSGSIYRGIVDDEAIPFLSEVLGFDVSPRGGIRSVDNDAKLGNYDIGEVVSLSAEINFDLGFATLTSLTGYKDHDYSYAEDFDGLRIGFNDYAQDQSGDYFEQELRLVSQSEGPLSWYGGVSYYKENIDAFFRQRGDEDVMCAAYYYYSCSEVFAYYGWGEFTPNPDGLLEANDVYGKYHGWGAYVDLTYAVTDKIELGAGMRYSKDTKEFGNYILPVDSDLGPFWAFGVYTSGYVKGKNSWDAFTPRFIARYRPNDDWMVYASATRGFKAGGFGSFAVEADDDDVGDGGFLRVADATLNQFEPETVWSYEVGVKGDMLNRRIRMDVSAYHYRYKDLQLNYFDKGTRVTNVGKVKSWGLEGTLQAIVNKNIDVFFAGSWNENEISGANAVEPGSNGNRLPGSPKFTFAGLASYHTEVGNGEMNASIDFRTQTKTYGGLGNIEQFANGGWSDFSARLSYESFNNWKITAYIENIFNEAYFDGTSESSAPFPAHGFGISRPRTVGMRLSYRFGQ